MLIMENGCLFPIYFWGGMIIIVYCGSLIDYHWAWKLGMIILLFAIASSKKNRRW